MVTAAKAKLLVLTANVMTIANLILTKTVTGTNPQKQTSHSVYTTNQGS